MDDNQVMGELLEHLEGLKLPEGQYLKFCGLLKEVNDKKGKEPFPLNIELLISGGNKQFRIKYNWAQVTEENFGKVNYTLYTTEFPEDERTLETSTIPFRRVDDDILFYSKLIDADTMAITIQGHEYCFNYFEWFKMEMEERKKLIEGIRELGEEPETDLFEITKYDMIVDKTRLVANYIQNEITNNKFSTS